MTDITDAPRKSPMKITVDDCIQAHSALAKHGGIELLPAVAIRFGRIAKILRDEAENAGDVLGQISRKHMVKGPDGKPLKTETPAGPTFEYIDPAAHRDEIKPVLKTEVVIEGELFKVSDLPTDKRVNTDLTTALHFLFTE